MSQNPYTESVVEEALLEWLGGLGYKVRPGPEITRPSRPPTAP